MVSTGTTPHRNCPRRNDFSSAIPPCVKLGLLSEVGSFLFDHRVEHGAVPLEVIDKTRMTLELASVPKHDVEFSGRGGAFTVEIRDAGVERPLDDESVPWTRLSRFAQLG